MNDTCDGCPFAGTGNCLIFCGADMDVVLDACDYCYYENALDDKLEYNREISEQLENVEDDLPF